MSAGGVERTLVVLDDVLAEVNRSIAKHGDQGHLPDGSGPTERLFRDARLALFAHLAAVAKRTTDSHSHSQGDGTVTWLDILLEEVFESFAENDPAKLRAELIQVAAVAVKWCEAIDRKAVSS